MFNQTRTTQIGRVFITLLTPLLIYELACGDERRIRQDYPLDRLTDKVYVIHGPTDEVSKENQGFRNNPILVVTQMGVVIIDPGSSVYVGEMLVTKARQLSDKPVIAVFNTHGHGDHWLGNHGVQKYCPDVTIYAHPGMQQALAGEGGEMWIRAINQLTDGAIEGTKVVLPNKSVRHGEEFTFGDVTIRVHGNGKGHTDHDLMLEVEEVGVFVFGDNLHIGNISPFYGQLCRQSGRVGARRKDPRKSLRAWPRLQWR